LSKSYLGRILGAPAVLGAEDPAGPSPAADHRVLVEIRDEALVIVAITLAHRSGIY
jgi:hypothetical protein